MTGKLLDYYKIYIIQLRVATAISALASSAIPLGYYHKEEGLMLVGQFFMALTAQWILSTGYEIITQHTFPADELLLGVWLTLLQTWGLWGALLGDTCHDFN